MAFLIPVTKPKYVAGFRQMKEMRPSKINQNSLKQSFYFLLVHGNRKIRPLSSVSTGCGTYGSGVTLDAVDKEAGHRRLNKINFEKGG